MFQPTAFELAVTNGVLTIMFSSFFEKGVVYKAARRVAFVPVAVVKTLAGRA